MSSFVSQFASVDDARKALGARWTAILRWAANCAGEGASLLADIQCENIGGPILLRVLKPWGSGPYVSHWLTVLRASQTTLDDTGTDLALGELANVERDLSSLLGNPTLKGTDEEKALASQLAQRGPPNMPGAALGARLKFAASADPLEQLNRALRWLPGAEDLGIVPPERELTALDALKKAGRWLTYGAIGAGLGYVAIKVAPAIPALVALKRGRDR
jgi:hypothetical protein